MRRKFYSLVLLAAGLLIGTNAGANLPQRPVLSAPNTLEGVAPKQGINPEKTQVAEPQPFAMVAAQGVSARKLAPRKAALSTEAITDDQVMLKVGETEIGLKSIVDAFKYVNTNCSATDSATIILQKSIDLAKEDYYSTGNAFYGVVLDANRKAVLDLNGFNFKSAIQTGSASGANDGKTSALIYNKGILCLTDNTFDYASIKNVDPATIGFDASSLCFFDESADTRKSPGYASNVVLNQGDLTIRGCKLSDTSYGSACYCVDQQTCSRDSITLWVESGFVYGEYTAVRQYFTNSTCRSKFVMNDGIFYAGTTCIWTQFNSNVNPKCKVYFSGGKCYAPNNYAYFNYPYGNNSTKDCSYNFSGTEFNSLYGNYLYGGNKDKEGEGTTVNIYGGKTYSKSDGYTYAFNTNYATINVYDGTFGDFENETWFACYGYHNTFNIKGGEFNNSYIYETSYATPAEGTNIWNITNGKFNNTYIYLYDVKNSTYNISGGVFTDSSDGYSIYASSKVSNCTFNLSDGTFGGDIADYGSNNTINVTGGLYRSDIYKGTSSTSTIDITGGYYAYGRMAHGKAYDDADMHWTNYIHSGYVDVINGTCKEDMQPWTSDDEYYYFYKVDQEVKTPATIDEDGKIVIPEESGETREPKPTDNIELNTEEMGRDTIYLDNLNVNGITFSGRDTIDVIAKPGSIVNIGSSGIKASDTTTVYMTVEGGGAMKVGVEAIQKVDTVIVKSDKNGNGTLLISPNAQLTNEEKFATVKLYVDGARKVNDTYYVWQHIAVPTDGTGTFTVENDRKATDPSFRTYVKWWNVELTSADKWQPIDAWEDMNKPWHGFILTTNSTTQGVTYSFTGNIIGNNDGQLHFDSKGYNFFGNSFTGPINVQTMLNGISNGEDIEMTVWIYSADNLRYLESNNLMRLLGMAEFDQISSMQGFWLRNMTDSYDMNSSVNYTNAVWNNPGAMGNPKVNAPARQTIAADMNLTVASIIVSDFDQSDRVILVEGEDYSNEFDNGSDASKMMTEGAINLYATTPVGDLACIATDNMEGTLLAFQASEQNTYSITFSNVMGDDYVLYDMMTGESVAIEENNTYIFTAEPKSVNSARFLVCSARKMPTALDNCETAFQVSGVYTMMGQYMGNSSDFANLPNGVYVINGIKVVK